MTDNIVTPAQVRAAFHNGDLDHTLVQALTPKGEPRFDKDGKPVMADSASLFSGPQGKGRGRLNPAFVKAYLDANGGEYVENKVKGPATVQVPMFSPKTGRPVKPLVKTAREVREAAGKPDSRGRISRSDLHVAAKAFGSGDPKPKAKPKPKP